MPENKTRTFFQDYSALMMDIQELEKNESNPFFKSSYVPLKDVLAEAKRVCLSNNFIFIQLPFPSPDNTPWLKTVLQHISGEKIEAVMPLVAKEPDNPQKIGGALTYMRRYSLTSILGLIEKDDDGSEASGNTKKDSKNEPPF